MTATARWKQFGLPAVSSVKVAKHISTNQEKLEHTITLLCLVEIVKELRFIPSAGIRQNFLLHDVIYHHRVDILRLFMMRLAKKLENFLFPHDTGSGEILYWKRRSRGGQAADNSDESDCEDALVKNSLISNSLSVFFVSNSAVSCSRISRCSAKVFSQMV